MNGNPRFVVLKKSVEKIMKPGPDGFPIIGLVAAGSPTLASENIESKYTP